MDFYNQRRWQPSLDDQTPNEAYSQGLLGLQKLLNHQLGNGLD